MYHHIYLITSPAPALLALSPSLHPDPHLLSAPKFTHSTSSRLFSWSFYVLPRGRGGNGGMRVHPMTGYRCTCLGPPCVFHSVVGISHGSVVVAVPVPVCLLDPPMVRRNPRPLHKTTDSRGCITPFGAGRARSHQSFPLSCSGVSASVESLARGGSFWKLTFCDLGASLTSSEF